MYIVGSIRKYREVKNAEYYYGNITDSFYSIMYVYEKSKSIKTYFLYYQ